MNSREKGKRGERQWRDELRAQGYAARRGQQFAGSPESPDVICDDLDWAHFEVKLVERLNVYDAMAQAHRDCGLRIADCGVDGSTSPQPLSPSGEGIFPAASRVPFVCHRRNCWPWLVTITADTLFKFLRGELPPERTGAVRQEPSKNQTEKEQIA